MHRNRTGIRAGALTLSALALATSAAHAREGAVEEIVVTGSYISRSTLDSASPLAVVDRVEIEQQGAIEVTDLISRMPYNTGSTNATNSFSGGDASNGTGNFNLRNLGLGSTLVLLDGRRHVAQQTDAGGNAYVNVTTLVPTIAIQRIEVVKDGASALYGSDAVAGVVNLITRTDFEGIELQLDGRADQATWDQRDTTVGGIFGTGSDRGHLVASFEYLDRTGQLMADRPADFGNTVPSTLGRSFLMLNPAARADFGALGDSDCERANEIFGGGAFRSPLTGDPLAGLLDGNGGCLYDATGFFPVVGEEKRLLTHISGHYALNDTVELYGSFGYADQEWGRRNSLYPLVRFPVIPASSPGLLNELDRRGVDPASIGGGALFFGRVLGGTPATPDEFRPVDTDTRSFRNEYRTVAGVRGDLPMLGESWGFDASFTYSERENRTRNTDTRQQQLELAVRGFGGQNCDPLGETAGSGNFGSGNCYYWNPFYTGVFQSDGTLQTDPTLYNPPELINWMVGEIVSQVNSEQQVVDAVVSGDLFELPNGMPVSLAVGGQLRRDQLSVDNDADSNANNFSFIFGAADFSAKETAVAAFTELFVPITSNLDLQLAARYERFDELDDGSFDPKATLLFRPTDALAFRGSVGTSFRVGSLLQRFGTSTQLLNFQDEFSDAALAFRPAVTVGNPELQPEEALAFNLGFSWSPTGGALDGLSVDVDYYNYDYDNLITRENEVELVTRDAALRCPQGLNDAGAADYDPGLPLCGAQTGGPSAGEIISLGEGIPETVIRDENLNFLRLEPTFVNAQKLSTDGVDFNVSYDFSFGNLGAFTAAVQGTWTRTYDLTLPSGETFDGVGSRNASNTIGRALPEWKLNYSLAWNRDRHSLFVLARFTDSYEDDQQATAGGVVGPLLRARLIGRDPFERTIDSWTTWDLQYSYTLPQLGPVPDGARISVGGLNIFDERPPLVNNDMGFDPTAHDARGAIWYGRVTVQL
jgi:iron complex outermembrane receptor protein